MSALNRSCYFLRESFTTFEIHPFQNDVSKWPKTSKKNDKIRRYKDVKTCVHRNCVKRILKMFVKSNQDRRLKSLDHNRKKKKKIRNLKKKM